MTYMLTEEPQGQGPAKNAFEALDEAYGCDEFTESQAVQAIANAVSVSEEEAARLFSSLKSSGCVSEV